MQRDELRQIEIAAKGDGRGPIEIQGSGVTASIVEDTNGARLVLNDLPGDAVQAVADEIAADGGQASGRVGAAHRHELVREPAPPPARRGLAPAVAASRANPCALMRSE